MRDLSNVLAYAATTQWLIEERTGAVLLAVLGRAIRGEQLSQDELARIRAAGEERIAAHDRQAADGIASSGGQIAVIPLVGVMQHRAGMFGDSSGMTSVQSLVKRLQAAAADPLVKSIVLDIDSPGGSVEGIQEAAAAVAGMTKPVVAQANTMIASAAYWIASQADEIVVTPSGEVGSIGVLMVHEEVTKWLEQEGLKVEVIRAGKYKAEGNPFEPLTEEARAEFQRQVDVIYGDFVKAVASGRGVTPAAVRGGFGQGRMVLAKEAIAAGMADRVATLDETIQRLAGGGRVKKRSAAAEATEEAPPAPAEQAATVDDFDDLDLRERALRV